MAKDRLPSELLSQYVADYGEVRDDDPNGCPLSALKEKIQSIISNPDLKRGNPPPIRPRVSTGLVIKRPPESAWERRVKIAGEFPETMTSTEIYERLGLDSKRGCDKQVVSRVMRAVGFVAKRGKRSAVWEKVANKEMNGDWVGKEPSISPSPPPLPHHTDNVTVTPGERKVGAGAVRRVNCQ
jgi:hypothetical protein